MKKRTKSQNSKMFGLAAKIGVTHEDLQEMAFDVSAGRTDHTSELYTAECDKIIKKLESFLPQEKSRRTENHRKQEAGIKTVRSAKATKYLKDLWLKFPHRTLKGLSLVSLNTLGCDFPRTAKQTSALIEAVKSMNEREERKQSQMKGRAA